MSDLWRVVGELTVGLHADRIPTIAEAILRLKSADEFERVRAAFGPNADQDRVDRLRACWEAEPTVGSAEIAAAFRGAAQVATLMDTRGAIELAWTGPKTGLIPTRQTGQVMLEVIDSARNDLFLVTYAFYRASSIVAALESAIARGVAVSILLESSMEHGGMVRGDSVKAVRDAVTGALIYIWDPAERKRDGGAVSAAVHAKCVVADGNLAFITSANLTSAALERNMELGLLIRGGDVPQRLHAHLVALVATKVIQEWPA